MVVCRTTLVVRKMKRTKRRVEDYRVEIFKMNSVVGLLERS